MIENFTGKKLLISLEQHGLLKSNKIFSRLQGSFSPAQVITTYGQKDTLYTALNENPDVIFFHYDSDDSFEPITDMQWQIHEMSELKCKLMLYSGHDDSHSHYSLRNFMEAVNRITFVETQLGHDEVVNRVSRCLLSKGARVLIASDLYFNWIVKCLNIFFPGTQIIYPHAIEEMSQVVLGQEDFVIIGYVKAEEARKVLDILEVNKAPANVLMMSYDKTLEARCQSSALKAHYIWGSPGTAGGAMLRFLDPYLGN